jgi:hypothetical protein
MKNKTKKKNEPVRTGRPLELRDEELRAVSGGAQASTRLARYCCKGTAIPKVVLHLY